MTLETTKQTDQQEQAPAVPDGMESIESLFVRLDVPKWQAKALMVHEGWSQGKAMTEKQFKAALKKFLGAPIGGEKS
ncbi:hypothetical protein SAMN05518846_101473 [Brevibacillus centrosporus]|uniref:Uncharacterized protein n=1 Tax=Brevibacillus centrosporus TaxID=54910 RepID=A0A1I3LZF6_9BACL|nr:hypothetical protein SAMN05518846_101473 [Brevibacillus centrosporus]